MMKLKLLFFLLFFLFGNVFGQEISITAGLNSSNLYLKGLGRTRANYRSYFFVGVLGTKKINNHLKFKSGLVYNPKNILEGSQKNLISVFSIPATFERKINKKFEIESGLQIEYFFRRDGYFIDKYGISFNIGSNYNINKNDKIGLSFNRTLISLKKEPNPWETYFRTFNLSIQHKF